MEEVLRAIMGGPDEVARAMRQVHREKSFELGEGDYTGRIDLEKVARLHAYHIALLSRLERPRTAHGLTGLDLRLADAFANAASTCGQIEEQQGDEFFRLVVHILNEIVERLCGGPGGGGGGAGHAQQGQAQGEVAPHS